MRVFFVFLFSSVSMFMALLALWFFFTKPKTFHLLNYIRAYDPALDAVDKEQENGPFVLDGFALFFYQSILGRSTYELVRKVHGDDVFELNKTIRLKLLIGLVGIMLSMLLILDSSALTWTMLLAIGSFWVPDLLLKNTFDKKQIEIGRLLPDTIDLLNLCGEAGLGFEAAVSRVATIRKNFITDELGRFLMEMQAGKTRTEAISSLISRNTNPEFIRFLTAVKQSERLGIPISKVLHEQASDLRARFRDLSKENAQKVTVKILAPVMLCFLPATFVVVLGPAVLGLIEAFS
ncbi:MAG: type II secretion system F family protein [Candidatus Nanopelagicales bacterium]